MDVLSPTMRGGLGVWRAIRTRRRYFKPLHLFKLSFKNDDQYNAERLYEFALYHRGDTAFYFDGGGALEISNPIFLFLGDGATTQFSLPFDNLFGPTWSFFENGIPKTDWTLTEASGALTFTTAPANNSEISGKGKRKAKVKFWFGGDAVYSRSEFFLNLYSEGIELHEVP